MTQAKPYNEGTGKEVKVRIQSSLPKVHSDLLFDGTNPETLLRLIALVKLELAFAEEDSDAGKSAWLAQHFSGAALDWIDLQLEDDSDILDDFEELVVQVKYRFGITHDALKARYQAQFDALQWTEDTPIFLAEFDRLTMKLGLATGPVRLQLLRTKLPAAILNMWADQGYYMVNYDQTRERLYTRHALRYTGPNARSAKNAARPKCGSCGKKGHVAGDCRAKN